MSDKRFEQLVADHYDHAITEVERAELETDLLESAEARKTFAEAAITHVQMTETLGHELPEVPRPHGTRKRAPLMLWIAAAAALALVTFGSWRLSSTTPATDAVVLLDAVAPTWTTPTLAPGEGASEGHFFLKTGLAKLHLAAGAEIILAGPCEFEVPKRGDCVLHRGRLTAQLTPGVDGFTVRTPHGRIVDLGTAFGLDVGTDKTELHVFSGRVAAIFGDAEIEVGANAALTFDANGVFGSITYAPEEFQRNLPTGRDRHVMALQPVGHWNFDRDDLSVGRFQGTLVSGSEVGDASTAAASFAVEAGNALELSGNNAIDLGCAPQFERNQPFSIGVWFRPADDIVHNRAILSQMDGNFRGWDLFWMSGNHVCVHVIHQWDQGGGKINNSARMYTETAFQPGKWYHLTVTYDGSSTAEGFRIFVNGADQPTRITHNNLSRTIVSDATMVVGKRPIRFHDPNTPPVRGAVDEVVIFDRRLTPAEVSKLYGGGQQ
jgi:hypothetical protein